MSSEKQPENYVPVPQRESQDGGPPNTKIDTIKQKVESTKTEIHKSLKDLADRGQKLDILKEKTEQLASSSEIFKKTTKDTRKKMWWKNTRMTVILCVVCVVILAVIIVPLILKTQNKI